MSKGLPTPEEWYSWRTNSVNDNFQEIAEENDPDKDEDHLNIVINELAKSREEPGRDFSSDDLAGLKEQSGKELEEEVIDEESFKKLKKQYLEFKEEERLLSGMSRNQIDWIRHHRYLDRVREGPKRIKRDLVEPLFTSRVYENLMPWIDRQERIIGCIYDQATLSSLKNF